MENTTGQLCRQATPKCALTPPLLQRDGSVEAGLSDQIEVIRCDSSDPEFDTMKAKLTAGLRKPASFPTVENEPGRYESDSDALIRHYATKNGVRESSLPALAFYTETSFPQLLAVHEQKSGAETRKNR